MTPSQVTARLVELAADRGACGGEEEAEEEEGGGGRLRSELTLMGNAGVPRADMERALAVANLPALQAAFKTHTKYARQNGIHVSPSVCVDGVFDGAVSSSWTVEQWLAHLAVPALKAAHVVGFVRHSATVGKPRLLLEAFVDFNWCVARTTSCIAHALFAQPIFSKALCDA